ncbi:DUF2780 domain-containing protein [Sulfurimonas sp.]|nr:DUF2780 domain-containing protein [Sulfurimonas sp.]
MLKTISSILLVSTLSQAGMFDSVVSNLSNEATSAIAPKTTAPSSNGLFSSLTDSLNVTPTQASGGTAALMQYAKSKTSVGDYSKMTESIPGLKDVSSGASMLGALGGTMDTVESVNSAFKSLGMDSAMVSKFIPVIKNFMGGSDKGESQSILTKALSAFM